MYKKNNLYKKKQKCSVEEAENLPKEEPYIKGDEKYINVDDSNFNKKYGKRIIENNWSKYEANISEFQCPEQELQQQQTNDFEFLSQNPSTDCSIFQFNSEKQWDKHDPSVFSSDLFNIDLDILSRGLACLPFPERINFTDQEISMEDKLNFEKDAEKNRVEYEKILNKSKRTGSKRNSSKCIIENKTELIDELIDAMPLVSFVENLSTDDKIKSENSVSVNEISKTEEHEIKRETEKNLEDTVKTVNNKEVENVEKIFFDRNDENLEDWLDSLLDD